ncbi:hypothetical protein ACH470_43525, partial [Streptomyces bottropensis]
DQGHLLRCHTTPTTPRHQQTRHSRMKMTKPYKAPKKNFSARPIPKDDNGAGGRLMADFYRLNRIIDGSNDGFLIEIVS